MVVEVGAEDVFAPAVSVGVLFPEQRVGRNRPKLGEVPLDKRARLDQLSHQRRLPIHASSPSSSHSRQTQSPSCPSALSTAGTIVTPQRGQIGGRSSSSCTAPVSAFQPVQ